MQYAKYSPVIFLILVIHKLLKGLFRPITQPITHLSLTMHRQLDRFYMALHIGPFRHSDISVKAVNQHGGRVLIYIV